MTTIDVIREAQELDLTDEDGAQIELSLLPPLTESEVEQFESTLPCPLPHDVADLLKFCRGFDGVLADQVDFTGESMMFEHEVIFPHGLPIAADGYGNFWVVDLTPDSDAFAPIYFACHDAPVILYQSATLEEFLRELFRMYCPPHHSLIDDVHEDRIKSVWTSNPGVLEFEDYANSSDQCLREFAKELDASFQVVDLRCAVPGDGFSWGRYGPNTVIKRFGNLPIFAYQKKKGFLGRLLGK